MATRCASGCLPRCGPRDGLSAEAVCAAELARWHREGVLPLQAAEARFAALAEQVTPVWQAWQAQAAHCRRGLRAKSA